MAQMIVLMGPQGVGKGTQGQMLAEKFDLPIVATGDMLREIARTDTELGHHVRETQAVGKLVSDDILAEIVGQRTSQCDCEKGCILDGFPRTLPQAELLESIAEGQGHSIVVIKIEVPSDLLLKRLAGRRTCSSCGAIYNIYFKPSRQEGVCDLDGQLLFKRSDDNEEAIAQRLTLYNEKTSPLLKYYADTNRLYTVEGTGAPEDVSDEIAEIVARNDRLSVGG